MFHFIEHRQNGNHQFVTMQLYSVAAGQVAAGVPVKNENVGLRELLL